MGIVSEFDIGSTVGYELVANATAQENVRSFAGRRESDGHESPSSTEIEIETTMRRKCCVPGCDSGTKCSICQVGCSYFKRPKDPAMARKWELALGLKGQGLQSQDRVCSSHFGKYDIITKRFVSLKRPTTNSKMIYEIAKLERCAVPTVYTYESKQCTHRRAKFKSSVKCNAKSCRTESAASEPTSSQSDDTEDSSADDQQQQQSQAPLPTRKDYRAIAESVANRSKRRQLRAFNNLRAKWLEKKKTLAREIRLLDVRIAQLGREEEDSFESD